MSLDVRIVDGPNEAALELADEIAALVRSHPNAVLGIATGSTPVGVYADLARRVASGALSFARVTTFNLDEFLDLPRDHPHTFGAWTTANVARPLGIDPRHMHLPVLDVAAPDLAAAAARYERAIEAAGGLDLVILGIGRNGHLAFNEPGSEPGSRTRAVALHPWTREDAVATFGGLAHVPQRALTMGLGTISSARRLRCLAFGERKAEIVRQTLDGPVCTAIPATQLRNHSDARLWLDRPAAALTSWSPR